ncbi:unnamed protein product [Litomosoides sigmodontis]|uniref:Uncharacterized protein n=1 Tax=Litomosoides sigmodontis TaxID=42156 RepID=A0A3P6T8E3_LITSI|nr:unnamed protein product [Litomosoides sigmodontis]
MRSVAPPMTQGQQAAPIVPPPAYAKNSPTAALLRPNAQASIVATSPTELSAPQELNADTKKSTSKEKEKEGREPEELPAKDVGVANEKGGKEGADGEGAGGEGGEGGGGRGGEGGSECVDEKGGKTDDGLDECPDLTPDVLKNILNDGC